MQPLKMFPRYENTNPIPLTDVVRFFEEEYEHFVASLLPVKDTFILGGISIDLSIPHEPSGYIISMCIDLDNIADPMLRVEIPFTDIFLPIKNDINSIRKAVTHIIQGTIPMLNVTANIDTSIHDYVRLEEI